MHEARPWKAPVFRLHNFKARGKVPSKRSLWMAAAEMPLVAMADQSFKINYFRASRPGRPSEKSDSIIEENSFERCKEWLFAASQTSIFFCDLARIKLSSGDAGADQKDESKRKKNESRKVLLITQ